MALVVETFLGTTAGGLTWQLSRLTNWPAVHCWVLVVMLPGNADPIDASAGEMVKEIDAALPGTLTSTRSVKLAWPSFAGSRKLPLSDTALFVLPTADALMTYSGSFALTTLDRAKNGVSFCQEKKFN